MPRARLVAAGVGPQALVRLVEIQPPSELELGRGVGESLPGGLRLLEPVDQEG